VWALDQPARFAPHVAVIRAAFFRQQPSSRRYDRERDRDGDASARVETFSFLFAFSKCSCAVEGEIPSLRATSRSVAPRAMSRRASISRLVNPTGGAANPCFGTRLRSRS
jgi:hypothetical protein